MDAVVTTIGAADSPAVEVFEYIADVALDAAGDLYVLDGFAHEVRRFGLDGTFRRRFGREGDGPIEFRNPVAIDVDPTGLYELIEIYQTDSAK